MKRLNIILATTLGLAIDAGRVCLLGVFFQWMLFSWLAFMSYASLFQLVTIL